MAKRNIKDVIAEAVDTKNAKLAGQIADVLRFRHGMNYTQVLEAVRAVRPVTDSQWEDLMYEADHLSSQEG